MITIEIAEKIYTDKPNDKGQDRSDVDMFIDGFKQLCEKTHVSSTIFNGRFGIIKFNFEDGTSIESTKLYEELGHIIQ